MSVPPPPTASMAWHAAPFTVAQWQELEHQALIFKYLKAGLSVPPDLLAPIRRSLQLMPPKLSQYQALGYYGKKIDPEPGRCRRTDGKKWRCSRDAHPDSKYCDRHMIRRRYRSRKPVESSQQSQSQQQPHASSATNAAATTAGATSAAPASAASGTFHALPLHTNGAREGFTLEGSNSSANNRNSNSSNSNSSLQHLQMGPLSLPSEVSKKEFRFALNSEADEHNFLQKDLGTVRYQGYDFTSDGMWSMSHVPSNTVSESRTGSTVVGNYFEQRSMRDSELLNLDNARTKELVFGGHQLTSSGCMKQEYQSPQSLFTDWNWKKDLGSDALEYRPSKDFNSDANC